MKISSNCIHSSGSGRWPAKWFRPCSIRLPSRWLQDRPTTAIVCAPMDLCSLSQASWPSIRKARTILKMTMVIACCRRFRKATLLSSTNCAPSSTLPSHHHVLLKRASSRRSKNMASGGRRPMQALSRPSRIANTLKWTRSASYRPTSVVLSSAS